MQRIARQDELLADLSKPALEPTAIFRLREGDCVIVCAGFEERSLGILKNALLESQDFSIVIIDYRPYVAENRLDEIRALCGNAQLRTEELIYDRLNPDGFGASLIAKIAQVNGRIFLDVSAMSRLLIVQCLVSLGSRETGFKNCSVAYSQATSYPPSAKSVQHALSQSEEDPMYSILLLSSGVFDICIIPELSSTSVASSQSRLVAFPTFSPDQLTALRNELSPSRLTFIHGIPPSAENKWRPDAIAKINHLDLGAPDNFCTSTLDYRETLDCLLQIYGSHSERERLLISPTGSKMQSVAVGLFRAFLNDIQIVYPTPKEFLTPGNYTKGIGQLYALPLDSFTLP